MKTERNSNIELLRIFSMFMIFAGHFIGQNWLWAEDRFLLVFLRSGLRIACNVFLIISAWFLVEQKFRAHRILSLYGQLVFYSWLLTMVSLVFFRDFVTVKTVAQGFLPFIGRALWFASAYITLLLFAPLLNEILKWEKKKLRLLVFLLFYFVSLVSTIPDLQVAYVCDSLWCEVVYLIIGYLKKYPIRLKIRNGWRLGIALFLYLAIVTVRYLHVAGAALPEIVVFVADQYVQDIKTIPNFMIALCLVFFVLNLRPRRWKLVNTISGPVFAVYLFHQVPAFFPLLWKYCFHRENPGVWYVLWAFLCVYLVVTVLEYLRKKVLEPIFLRCWLVRKAEESLEQLYQSVDGTDRDSE